MLALVKFIFHYIVFPTLCAVIGVAIDQVGGLSNLLNPLEAIPAVGGFMAVMGGAFIAALIALLGEKMFLALYKSMRGAEYKEGEFGSLESK